MTAQLGWVIVYVPDVDAALAFYEQSFGLERKSVAPDASFGELDSGATTLAFASEQLAESNFEGGFERPGERPVNVEIALVFDDPEAAFARTVENGATVIAEPKRKPWGQLVSYVRDPFGTLLEVCSPTE
jgi:predicted enzyme related to lactoylglutathione lyase